jgi:MYXO-CTERM domain-containing protein
VLPESGEVCDGRDEDCDGAVDENVDCGEFMGCHLGGCVDLGMPPSTTPAEPEPEDVPAAPVEVEGGCACDTTQSGSPDPVGAAFVLTLMGLGVLRRVGVRRPR